MAESPTGTARTPRHLWIIGVAALLWNAIGAYDYSMTQARNAAYMAGFTPEQLTFVYGLPALVRSAWAVGVWGGVAGSLLLLLRRRLAVWVYLASIIGVVTLDIHNYVLSNGLAVAGDAASLILASLVAIVALGLFTYASIMHARGVLA